ncbi:MAG: tol-pal system protein YbgF [Gammaproteobacteria bacterium]|nr:tol-pal system protein YbgF [Gammaproteobacteria bacterium]MBU2058902.1 tol-pal system protein YbgF [Gammaproteobacteria bacterium]MBU2177035.1 tol-pal system protein YbgF [Gammaproteobacteria bacterium]MBU2247021.1 tol-pal system protein YbgF [Gammaproteobacteria bacterium]MBU2342893.1 tol-pal system protein YbgF [Gammaproteobacteria bacterium]
MKKYLVTALSVISIASWADPAPVADLSRAGGGAIQTPKYASTADRIAALERIVEARANAQVTMQQQVSALLDEVSELRGVTEMHSYKLEEILQQQRNIYQEIDRRLGSGATSGSTSATPATPNTVTPAEQEPIGNPAALVNAGGTQTAETIDSGSAAASSSPSENDTYESAVNLVLKDRNYDAAIPAFENFVRSYPNSSYAPNAYYWLGQLFFTKNELLKAKAQFERVVAQYPQSAKAADSLAKLGQLAEREGDTAAARQFYQLLVSKYPQSKPAKAAKAKLETL